MGKQLDFYTFKILVIETTGLAKDALHIYVGVSVYLACLIIFSVIFKKQSTRQLLALIITTCVALAGEGLDIRYNIAAQTNLKIGASLHDLVNTCLLPYVLYALNRWTNIFR